VTGLPLRRDRWVIGATLAGAGLRLVHLGAAPLWFDETLTADWIRMPWGALLMRVLHDNHPPLYFVLVKAWMAIAGDSAWALRLLSVAVSLAVIPLTAALADALADRAAARWAGWFAALSPYLVHHAQEARMYALVSAFGAANVLLVARFLTGRTRALGPLFVVTALGLVASHYYTVFFLGGELLVLLVLWRRPLAAWLPAGVAAAGLAGAALLSAALIAKHSAGGDYALGVLALPGAVWSMVSGYVLMPDSEALHGAGARAALRYLPIAGAAAIPLAVVGIAALRRLDRTARLVLIVPLVTLLAAPFTVRLLLGVAVNPRYFMAGAPSLMGLLAIGASRRPLSGAAVGLLLAVALGLHLAHPGHGREDLDAAGAWLDAHVGADEEVLVTSEEMDYLAEFHWKGHRFRLYPPARVVATAATAPALAAALPFPASGRVVYVVGRAWLSDPADALQHELAARYAQCPGLEARGVRILCLEPAAGDAAR
jgi:uncharacterized membrane protein